MLSVHETEVIPLFPFGATRDVRSRPPLTLVQGFRQVFSEGRSVEEGWGILIGAIVGAELPKFIRNSSPCVNMARGISEL